MARKVVTRETEWDDREQAWMLALADYRATRCPSCGQDIRECTAPDADGRYHVGLPVRCHATTALSIARKAYVDTPQSEALLWRTERRR